MNQAHHHLAQQWHHSCQIIHFFQQRGVAMAFLAPGMRCAPLYGAIEQQKMPWHSVWDERALGFQALGYGREKVSPPLIACTSGTAAAHFYPAIIEAWQSRQPLVVLTCDRPQRLRGSDASQTIYQENLFGRYTCFHCSWELYRDLGPKDPLLSTLALAAQAMAREQRPIHLNLAYEEPLLNPSPRGQWAVAEAPMPRLDQVPDPTPSVGSKQGGASKVTSEITRARRGDEGERDFFDARTRSLLAQWQRPLVVIGSTDHLPRENIIAWLKKLSVPFFADITSQVKTQTNSLAHSITSLDAPWVLNYLQATADGILHIGGPVVSQNYPRALDQLSRPKVVQLAPYFFARILSHRILYQQKIAGWPKSGFPLEHFSPAASPPAWQSLLRREHLRRQHFIRTTFNAPTHYHVVHTISRQLTDSDVLVIGNSTPIRSFNDYFYATQQSVRWQFQRGVSGIEGLIARSKGVAMATPGRVLCILGDISASHDFSSLVGTLPKNLKVLIVNNQRGGLFSRLGVLNHHRELQQMIETPHSLTFSSLCGQWPTWAREAGSLREFLQGPGQLWELLIDHQKDLQEWQELEQD